jgi:hypothetical protein
MLNFSFKPLHWNLAVRDFDYQTALPNIAGAAGDIRSLLLLCVRRRKQSSILYAYCVHLNVAKLEVVRLADGSLVADKQI